MKDKRTYNKLKEHGEDMSHENESKVDPKEDRGALDITLLTEQYKSELNKYMERESLYIKTDNQLKATKQIVIEIHRSWPKSYQNGTPAAILGAQKLTFFWA